MVKEVMYVYLGTNGTICSPVHLEDVYYIRKIRLTASPNKRLTKNGIDFMYQVIIPEEELPEWYEVNIPKGQI
jgi:hypothetical protein